MSGAEYGIITIPIPLSAWPGGLYQVLSTMKFAWDKYHLWIIPKDKLQPSYSPAASAKDFAIFSSAALAVASTWACARVS